MWGSTRIRKQLLASNRHARVIYSQEGEDALIARLLDGGKGPGFYVDVGAFHPIRFSNTYGLYLRGWRGINIEPRPGARAIFERVRPRDTTLEIGIGEREDMLTYFVFADSALNTFDPAQVAFWKTKGIPSKGQETLPVMPLRQVLGWHVPKGRAIDIMSIDAEGFDLTILQSNDWEAFRPIWLVVELKNMSIAQMMGCEITRYLADRGYEPVSKLFLSSIYKDSTRTAA